MPSEPAWPANRRELYDQHCGRQELFARNHREKAFFCILSRQRPGRLVSNTAARCYDPAMRFDRYYADLGLARGASLPEVCHAYRRLALRHHPDRNVGDPDAQRRFVRISRAYRVLADHLKSGVPTPPGPCPTCGRHERVFPFPDGTQRCKRCLLARTARFLPLPALVWVRFYGVMACMAGSAGMIWLGLPSGRQHWLAASLLFNLAGMTWLAAATVWIARSEDGRRPALAAGR